MEAHGVAALVCGSLFLGTLAISSSPRQSRCPNLSFAARVAASAPDDHDQIGFLSGFETLGNHFVGTKTLTAGFSFAQGPLGPGRLRRSNFDAAARRQRCRLGWHPPSRARVGLRRFRVGGVALWSLLSGMYAGWGTVKVKRLVSASAYRPGGSLNYILAWAFYTGTFGFFAKFYFPERSGLLLFVAAITISYAGLTTRNRNMRQTTNTAFWGAGMHH